MARACIDYYGTYKRRRGPPHRVNTKLMGAFTTDPAVVQELCEAGIPVWWVRQDTSIRDDIVVVRLNAAREPRDVCQVRGADHGDVIY